MATKKINGRIYTHQTKENPSRYARFIDRLREKTDTYPIDVFLLNLDLNSEEYLCYKDTESFEHYPSKRDLIPIHDELEYHEGWINLYETGFGDTVHKNLESAKNAKENPPNYIGKYIKTLHIKYPKDKK